jgi:hypothetical protein
MNCARLESALNFMKYLESLTNHISYIKINVNCKFAPAPKDQKIKECEDCEESASHVLWL